MFLGTMICAICAVETRKMICSICAAELAPEKMICASCAVCAVELALRRMLYSY